MDLVLAKTRDAVTLLTLNRPERLNAWTLELEDAYFDALEVADADPQVRAVVVTGAGRGFCAGADLSVLAGAVEGGEASAAAVARRRPMHSPLLLRKPLIAAVNGAAAGLGFVHSLYADVRFASPQALFLTSFARRGLVAEYGVAWLLPRLVGAGRAADLLLSGRGVDGEEALRIGLVEHLVPAEDLLDAALAYARDLATWCSPTSLATMKTQLRLDAERSFEASTADAESLMRASFRGADLAEGLASFTERRPPAFAPLAPKEF